MFVRQWVAPDASRVLPPHVLRALLLDNDQESAQPLGPVALVSGVGPTPVTGASSALIPAALSPSPMVYRPQPCNPQLSPPPFGGAASAAMCIEALKSAWAWAMSLTLA